MSERDKEWDQVDASSRQRLEHICISMSDQNHLFLEFGDMRQLQLVSSHKENNSRLFQIWSFLCGTTHGNENLIFHLTLVKKLCLVQINLLKISKSPIFGATSFPQGISRGGIGKSVLTKGILHKRTVASGLVFWPFLLWFMFYQAWISPLISIEIDVWSVIAEQHSQILLFHPDRAECLFA